LPCEAWREARCFGGIAELVSDIEDGGIAEGAIGAEGAMRGPDSADPPGFGPELYGVSPGPPGFGGDGEYCAPPGLLGLTPSDWAYNARFSEACAPPLESIPTNAAGAIRKIAMRVIFAFSDREIHFSRRR
jgi:hypothetical protein